MDRRAGTSGRPIDIRRCDGSPTVISYLLKLAEHPDCHWEFSPSLQLFMPGLADMSTSQGRRRYRRFLARAGPMKDVPEGAECLTVALSPFSAEE